MAGRGQIVSNPLERNAVVSPREHRFVAGIRVRIEAEVAAVGSVCSVRHVGHDELGRLRYRVANLGCGVAKNVVEVIEREQRSKRSSDRQFLEITHRTVIPRGSRAVPSFGTLFTDCERGPGPLRTQN